MWCTNFLFCIVFSLVCEFSLALNCYQCSGSDPKDPFQCNEWLSSDIDIEPQACDNVYAAKYCIKHVGRFEGGIGAKRFCSSLDLGNYCNYVKQPGDILDYRTCVYTCTGDGCNPANNLKPYSVLSFVTALGIFIFRLN
ncbi:unnamed protein product [Psylliodes chrysocephalus]|uniref:Protein sleepless n=1 Tax=Psylliodes chrysocephalus TaxID=3402493 RepID=A0A9P0CUJ6_9CUCU|nr:unnamed protein product [Psylliodes chrysocephala]